MTRSRSYPRRARSISSGVNLRVHGVSFAEAVTVNCMKKIAAEKYRDLDFSRAKRGPVVKPEPGKAKISIRLDNAVLEYFRTMVDKAGGGSYQTLINDALLEHIHRRAMLDVVRQVVREELAPYVTARSDLALQHKQRARR